MNREEKDFYDRMYVKYLHRLIQKESGRSLRSINELAILLADIFDKDDKKEALMFGVPWFEPEKIRLKNLHEILNKRHPSATGKLQRFGGEASDVAFWSGIIYGSYLQSMLSLNESINLCMELTGYGDNEPFKQIRQKLWEQRQAELQGDDDE